MLRFYENDKGTLDVSFSDLAASVSSLARHIDDTCFNDGLPIKVVTLARGGMPLATVVAHTLDIPAKDVIVISEQEEFALAMEIGRDTARLGHLLFVDDMFDTSKTSEYVDHAVKIAKRAECQISEVVMIAPFSRYPMSKRNECSRRGEHVNFYTGSVLNDSRFVDFEWETY